MYTRDFAPPDRPEGSISDVTVRQVGLYLQDQWAPRPGFVLTAGLRFDVPFLLHGPPQNQTLSSSLGVNTRVTPSGNVLWSPRVGFNWDVGGRATTFLRGGAGLFAGTAPCTSTSATCTKNHRTRLAPGDVQGERTCRRSPSIPHGSRPRAGYPVPFEVNYFDPSFRFPRNLRLSLGTDLRLPWAMTGTVDLLFIRGVDQFDITDVNLLPPTASSGEGGRLLYGTIDEFGAATPNRRNQGFQTVAEIRNSSGDHSISASGQLEKRFRSGTEVTLAYTYTDAGDRISPDCFNVTCNLDFTPVDGSLESRALTTSTFSVRHKITLGVIAEAPLRIRAGLFYVGSSGRPYTYMISGDANADGLSLVDLGNDAIYVPRNAADITLDDPAQWPGLRQPDPGAAMPAITAGAGHAEEQLPGALGHAAQCAAVQGVRDLGGRSLELITDVFNLLNLFDRDWGVQRTTPSSLGDPEILQLLRYDQENQRGVYNAPPIHRKGRDDAPPDGGCSSGRATPSEDATRRPSAVRLPPRQLPLPGPVGGIASDEVECRIDRNAPQSWIPADLHRVDPTRSTAPTSLTPA